MHVTHPLVKKNTLEKRAYQIKLFEMARDRNTLVVAPTALGKTIVAVLLSAHYLEKHPDKKVLMLSPTRPLASQHAASLRRFLSINESAINVLTGNNPASERTGIWQNSSVISATPHVIKNDFSASRYHPSDLSLVIFDEAHRAVGDYPYTAIASSINCRVLALTASPGSREEYIRAVCTRLGIEDVEILNDTDSDVSPYIKGLEVEWKKVALSEPLIVMRNLLRGMLKKRLERLKKARVLPSADPKITKKELLSAMSDIQTEIRKENRKELYESLSLTSGCLTLAHALDLLETQGLGSLQVYLKRTEEKARSPKSSKAVREISRDPDFRRVLALAENLHGNYEDPKIEALKNSLTETKKDTKVIIFTQYRDTATEIVENINRIRGVRAVRFVGQEKKGGDSGLSQKDQIRVLAEFRKCVYNVLVATSVAEEGLDIPDVDLVVFYEPVPSEIRAIQRRGRTGRSNVGKVVVLMAENTRDEGVYWSSMAKEKRMKKDLMKLKKSQGLHEKERITDWGA